MLLSVRNFINAIKTIAYDTSAEICMWKKKLQNEKKNQQS